MSRSKVNDNKFAMEGDKIRVTLGVPPFYETGNLAVLKSVDKLRTSWLADFNGLGNAEVHGNGEWYISSYDFELID